MTYNDILQLLRNRLGNRTDLDTNIQLELGIAQEHMENNLADPIMPWFMERRASITATGKAAVPTDFIREVDDCLPIFRLSSQAGYTELQKVFPEDLTKAKLAGRSDPPNIYALVGQEIELYPEPDGEYVLEFLYYGSEEKLSNATQGNGWSNHAPELLVAAAGKRLATYIHDAALAGVFDQDMVIAQQHLAEASKERKYANIDMRTKIA